MKRYDYQEITEHPKGNMVFLSDVIQLIKEMRDECVHKIINIIDYDDLAKLCLKKSIIEEILAKLKGESK